MAPDLFVPTCLKWRKASDFVASSCQAAREMIFMRKCDESERGSTVEMGLRGALEVAASLVCPPPPCLPIIIIIIIVIVMMEPALMVVAQNNRPRS